MAKDRTRLSLFYVATYLTGSGLAMTFAPRLTLDLLCSNRHYETTFVRMCGLFVMGLAAFVIQIIRNHLTVLYPTVIGVRVMFCIGYIALFIHTHDPFFLVTLGVVGLGLVASSISYYVDQSQK